MNAYKKLLGNSVVFAIGNLGSKLISILLVPLYTFYMTTQEYGMVDIVITTTSMLLPLISLSIYEATLRFALDGKEDTSKIFTNSLFITIIGLFILLGLSPFFSKLSIDSLLLKYLVLILSLQVLQATLAQFSRAIGKVKAYAFNGILMSFVIGGLNIYLLVYKNLGVEGYLLSIVAANVVSILFFSIILKIWKYIKKSTISIETMREMLKYSIPLIPNAFMWWIISASNRFFILYFVGVEANGLFAVANKIPSFLSILYAIFFQAWQISAIEEFNSKDKSRFYSKIFNLFSMVMFLGSSFLLIFLKYVVANFIAVEYYDSWKTVPFLLLSVVLSSFSSFLGTNYIAAKETKGVFSTSLLGGISNVALNFILVPFLGITGAAISTMISFGIMWVIRVIDTKKYIHVALDIKALTFYVSIFFLQTYVLFLGLTIKKEIFIELILFLIVFIFSIMVLKREKRIK